MLLTLRCPSSLYPPIHSCDNELRTAACEKKQTNKQKEKSPLSVLSASNEIWAPLPTLRQRPRDRNVGRKLIIIESRQLSVKGQGTNNNQARARGVAPFSTSSLNVRGAVSASTRGQSGAPGDIPQPGSKKKTLKIKNGNVHVPVCKAFDEQVIEAHADRCADSFPADVFLPERPLR